jgi:hypothetical protein
MAKGIFKVKTRFVFEGEFEVNSENKEQAREFVERHCGLVIGGGIHTSLSDEIIPSWNFSVHGNKKITSVKKARD